jgi:hypothetical protein
MPYAPKVETAGNNNNNNTLFRIGTDLKSGGHGLFQDIILVFTLRDQEKSGKFSDIIPDMTAETRT